MLEIGERMIEVGDKISDFGFNLIPISFFVYIILRPLDYTWELGYHKIVKAIWYLSSGIAMLVGDIRVETVVMFIAFIETYDLIFQYFEDKRVKKASR